MSHKSTANCLILIDPAIISCEKKPSPSQLQQQVNRDRNRSKEPAINVVFSLLLLPQWVFLLKLWRCMSIWEEADCLLVTAVSAAKKKQWRVALVLRFTGGAEQWWNPVGLAQTIRPIHKISGNIGRINSINIDHTNSSDGTESYLQWRERDSVTI